MRLVLTCGQQLCFLPTFFTRGGSRHAAAGSVTPVESGAPPSWNFPTPKLYIYPGFAATETGATREPLAPRTSLNILTYPASGMIMVQLIVRNPFD